MSIYCETIKADESGLTLAAQLLDGDGVALGDPITTGFTELATDSDNITHYWFAADIDLTTVKGIRFYDTGDATNFHTRTLKIAAAQTAATAAQSAAEAVETLTKADGAGDLAAIKTQTDKLSFTGTDVKATLDGEEVTPTSASKTGYSLTAAYDAAKTAGTSTLDAAGVRTELATELARIDATISSRHAAGAAVAKSPATLDWTDDVSNKPTIGTSTLTTSDIDARLTAYGAQKTGVAVTLPVPAAGFFANQPAVSVDVELPSSIPSGWLAAILTGKATSVVITTYLVTAGELVIEYNHDYPSSKNRAITFVNNGSFGDLTGSIPHLIIRLKGSNDIIVDSVGTINGSVDDPDSIEFDLTSEETGLLTNFSSKAYQYKVELRYTDGVVCGLIQENDCTVLW